MNRMRNGANRNQRKGETQDGGEPALQGPPEVPFPLYKGGTLHPMAKRLSQDHTAVKSK